MKSEYPAVSSLWFGCTEVTSVDYDWSYGYTEKWDFYEARSRDADDGQDLEDQHFVTNFDGSDYYTFDGPMMNYYYPMPTYDGDPREDCKKLADLPLCIVELHETEQYALALTGGGMDLSWEICEAYMRLGYLPPTHFQPPEMAGRGTSDRDRWILAGVRRALQSRVDSAKRDLVRLRERFPAKRKAKR